MKPRIHPHWNAMRTKNSFDTCFVKYQAASTPNAILAIITIIAISPVLPPTSPDLNNSTGSNKPYEYDTAKVKAQTVKKTMAPITQIMNLAPTNTMKSPTPIMIKAANPTIHMK